MTSTEIVSYELNLTTASLDELSEAASAEYKATQSALVGALERYVKFGNVLLEARGRVPDGEWLQWCAKVGAPQATVNHAMRVAYYADRLPSEMWDVSGGVGRKQGNVTHAALAYLRGLPDIHPKGRTGPDPKMVAEARRLLHSGAKVAEVAEMFGVHKSTIRDWMDPQAARASREAKARRKKQRRQVAAAARRQMEREERDRLAKTHGGELSEAYSLIRRALAQIDRARAADEAILHLHRAEAAIVAAMREQRRE